MKEKLTAPLAGLKNCFVAGGAITSLHTNKPINDYDIYPKSSLARDEAIFWAYEDGWWCVNVSSRALTFAHKSSDINMQIMLFDIFDSAEKIFECFDFTVCMGAYDLDNEKFIHHNEFLLHCSQRFLSFNPKTRFPYASAWRVRKYEEKGYAIGKMEFHKILMACAAKPINSWDELKEQVGGVYGESMEIPEGVEYSMEEAFKVISNMKPCGPMETFSSAEEAVACVSDREIPYFVIGEDQPEDELIPFGNSGKQVYAKLYEDGDWSMVGRKPLNGRLAGMDEVYPGLTFYKKVERKDGRLRSLYKPSFEYPESGEVSSPDPFLYCYPNIHSARMHGAYGKGECIILELKAEPQDVIYCAHQPRLKKCTVVAHHPVKE